MTPVSLHTPESHERTMLTLDVGRARFTYRIVGVAIDRDRALLHRAETDNFWSRPGGRAELGEPATETLRREMREELGAEVRVERLLWVVENFFGHDDRAQHELGLYFLMALPREAGLYERSEPFEGREDGLTLIFQWHRLDRLAALPLYPTFLREALRALPEAIAHVVHSDNPK